MNENKKMLRTKFLAKVGKIGGDSKSLDSKSFFVVIPKIVARPHELKKGDIVEMELLGKRTPLYYPYVDGVRDVGCTGYEKYIEKASKQLGYNKNQINMAISEANYLVHDVLNERQRILTLNRSVAAVALYVVGINTVTSRLPTEKFPTQERIAQILEITTETLRNQLKKGWKSNEEKELVRRVKNK